MKSDYANTTMPCAVNGVHVLMYMCCTCLVHKIARFDTR